MQATSGTKGVGTANSERKGIDALDPGGTGELANVNQEKNGNAGNDRLTKQPPVVPKNTVTLEFKQLKLLKKGEEHAMIPKNQKPNTVAAIGVTNANDANDEIDRT